MIGDLPNLPSYRGGVAIGPMLEEKFELPVFINNDGNLFAYGEAVGGLLPEVNKKLREEGIPKQYENLLGITIGTGFGGGIVMNNHICLGDNSASGEIWLTRNFRDLKQFAEEGVSIRALQRSYNKYLTGREELMTTREIYQIARGEKEGNREAAVKAFNDMADVLAESLANAITLVDGLVVIGGGVGGAYELFLPRVVEHLNATIEKQNGDKIPRLIADVYNLEDRRSTRAFYRFKSKSVNVPFSDREVPYVPEKRVAIGITRLGTSRATALGAYAYALNRL